MLMVVLTILVFIEMAIIFTMYRKLDDPNQRWLVHTFLVFFAAGAVAIPIERWYYHVASHMWELFVLSIGLIVILTFVSRFKEQKNKIQK